MSVARYTQPKDFSAGVLDDHFIFRITSEQYNSAARSLKNVDILSSGAVRTRNGAQVRANIGADARLFMYTEPNGIGDGTRYVIAIYWNGTDTVATLFDLDTNTATAQTIVAGENIVGQRMDFVQAPIGAFILAESGNVYYWPGVGNQASAVTWWGEMQGLYSGSSGSATLTPTSFPGTVNGTRAKAEVLPGGSATAEVLIATPGVSGYSDQFKTVDQAATSAGTGEVILTNPIDIDFEGARLIYRLSIDNVLVVGAMAYSRGRLILGGVFDALIAATPARRNYGYTLTSPGRVLMSRVGMPFCIWPGNDFPDSPIDFAIPVGAGAILWIAATETATYIGTPTSIVVVPSQVTYDTLDWRYVDTVGIADVKPAVLDNGIIYISSDGTTAYYIQYAFSQGAHKVVALNSSATKLFSRTVRVSAGDGQRSLAGARRAAFVQDDGRLVMMTLSGGNAAFSEYEVDGGITDAIVADGRLFAVSGAELIEFANTNRAWDFEESFTGTTISGSHLQDTIIGVSGVRNGKRVYLGAFETQGTAIKTKTYDGLGNPTYVDPDFSEYTSLLAGRLYEVDVEPFPAVGVDQKGTSTGRLSRVVSVKTLVEKTAAIIVNCIEAREMDQTQMIGMKDPDAKTGWFEFQGGGHGELFSAKITNSGYHHFTLCGVVFEVAV